MDTVTEIRAALARRKGEWPTLCQRTGLSYWWLTKLAQGRIAEPGLGKIERLQKYFLANPEPAAEAVEPASLARVG